MGLILSATAGTGTGNSPAPFAPFTRICTSHDPALINHNEPSKNCGSAVELCAISATGGCVAAMPVIGVGVSWISRTSGDSARTSMRAIPGITSGGRMATSNGYGPALPWKNTSGLPTCADRAGAKPNARAQAEALLHKGLATDTLQP